VEGALVGHGVEVPTLKVPEGGQVAEAWCLVTGPVPPPLAQTVLTAVLWPEYRTERTKETYFPALNAEDKVPEHRMNMKDTLEPVCNSTRGLENAWCVCVCVCVCVRGDAYMRGNAWRENVNASCVLYNSRGGE